MLSEPPGADPHAGWCGRGQGKPGLYPILRAPGGAIPPGDSPSGEEMAAWAAPALARRRAVSLHSIIVRSAGLSPSVGSHALRHTAAIEMLKGGATLVEIGEVLRHQEPRTTARYAKVDRKTLRRLARPWPEGGAA